MSKINLIEKELVVEVEESMDGGGLLRLLETSSQKSSSPSSINGVVIGSLIGIADENGAPFVSYEGQPEGITLIARTTVEIKKSNVGDEVVLMFEGSDPTKPLIMGLLHQSANQQQTESPIEIEADGKRLTISAKEQIVFRCGEASITLTKAGKVLIKGTYVSSHSTGTHRIKGGSVQIN